MSDLDIIKNSENHLLRTIKLVNQLKELNPNTDFSFYLKYLIDQLEVV